MANIIFFADNDLGEGQMTGLELIKQLGVSNVSYLITDSYSQAYIHRECLNSQIQLIPKQYVDDLKLS